MAAAVVAFDFEEVLPNVQRAHSRANRDDAEEAVMTAVEELLKKGKPLTAPNVVAGARFRLIDALRRRERSNTSLDAALEADVDQAPRELAIEEVDFDSHVALREISDHPVLRRRLQRVGAGLKGWLTWSPDEILEAIRVWAKEEGHPPKWRDCPGDPRLPASDVVLRTFGTWSEAIRQAGLEPNDPYAMVWPPARIVSSIRDFERETGRLPKQRDYRARPDLPNAANLHKRYGTEVASKLLTMLEAAA